MAETRKKTPIKRAGYEPVEAPAAHLGRGSSGARATVARRGNPNPNYHRAWYRAHCERDAGLEQADECALALRRPGKSRQNGICEAFNSTMGDGLLKPGLICRLQHVRPVVARLIPDRNAEPPRAALGYRPPAACAAELTAMANRLRQPERLRAHPSLRRRRRTRKILDDGRSWLSVGGSSISCRTQRARHMNEPDADASTPSIPLSETEAVSKHDLEPD
jgi:hypothetical protein